MTYEIQAKGPFGDWDASYVSSDPDATTFASESEADQAIEDIRTIGEDWAKVEYRIVEKD